MLEPPIAFNRPAGFFVNADLEDEFVVVSFSGLVVLNLFNQVIKGIEQLFKASAVAEVGILGTRHF